MKIFKYSFMVLALAVVANVGLASADRSLESYQTSAMGTAEIHVGQSVKTDGFIKEKTATQNFYNEYTFTTSTDPCPKCNIVATLQGKVNGKWSNVKSSGNTKMGERKNFNTNTAEAPGTYRLSIKRNDITAAITFVQYEWYIQPAN